MYIYIEHCCHNSFALPDFSSISGKTGQIKLKKVKLIIKSNDDNMLKK